MFGARIGHWSLVVLPIAVSAALGCASGEGDEESLGATVPLSVEGSRTIPNVSLEEAQELVDFRIAQPAALPGGVKVQGVLIRTSRFAPEQVDSIQLIFSGPGYAFQLMESDRFTMSAGGSTQPITINDVEGRIQRHERSDRPTLVTVTWTSGELNFMATAFLKEEMTEETFLEILESIP